MDSKKKIVQLDNPKEKRHDNANDLKELLEHKLKLLQPVSHATETPRAPEGIVEKIE